MSAPIGDPALINDVIAAVDVECLASDQPRGIVSEERGGNAHVVDTDEAPCRRFRGIVLVRKVGGEDFDGRSNGAALATRKKSVH